MGVCHVCKVLLIGYSVIGFFLLCVCVCVHVCHAQVLASVASKEQQVYAAAGAIAEEVLSAIRTVVALGREMEEAKR